MCALASHPGSKGGEGERRAWYQLRVHAYNFPRYWGNLYSHCSMPVYFDVTKRLHNTHTRTRTGRNYADNANLSTAIMLTTHICRSQWRLLWMTVPFPEQSSMH